VATHGLFRPESPRLSAFLLADGWFGLADVYGLRLRADLVVLSSCDGGLGGRLGGGESLGLARAFLLAGARALLSALGPVRDDAAAFFMDAFYGALGQGVPVAEAHRQAILAAREEFDHPALWGLFVLDGDGSARLPGVSS
jgi:CHAT domain-containing protein